MNLRLIFLFVLVVAASRVSAADTKTPVEAKAAAPVVPNPVPAAGRTAVEIPRSDSSVAPTIAFETFRLISDRNIFNPNRTGRRDRTVEEKPARVDVIALVGTMDSDRGLRAFFDGSENNFRKALRVGDSVDKFKVTRISPQAVELERDGKALSVRVGQQLRRPEGADWNLVGEEVARREAELQAAADTRINPSAPPVIPANVDAVTRRMMERRQKELKQ
jgi:hypothetical protein